MRELIAGGIGVLSGILLFGFTSIAAAVYSPQLRETGYSGEFGLYLSALWEVGAVPIIFSLIFFFSGLGFLFKATDREWRAKYFAVEEEKSAGDKEA